MEDHSSLLSKPEQPSLSPGAERQEIQCDPASEEKHPVVHFPCPPQPEGREVASQCPTQREGEQVFDAASNLQQQRSNSFESQSTSQPREKSKEHEEKYGLLQQFPDPKDKVATGKATVE
jgi:hypothetical protein